ncbi:MAG: hypothetical protein ABJC13_10635 [Acidobacteriota bacterium]
MVFVVTRTVTAEIKTILCRQGRQHTLISAKMRSMEPLTAGLIALGLLALVALAYLAVFRKKAAMTIKGPGDMGLSFDGTNEAERAAAGQVTIERARAKGSIEAANRTGGGARIADVEADQDIRATSEPCPKAGPPA